MEDGAPIFNGRSPESLPLSAADHMRGMSGRPYRRSGHRPRRAGDHDWATMWT